MAYPRVTQWCTYAPSPRVAIAPWHIHGSPNGVPHMHAPSPRVPMASGTVRGIISEAM